MKNLLVLFEIAPVNRLILEASLRLGFADFEDAVLYEAGRHVGVQGIVTRDSKGFSQAVGLPIYSPTELLQALAAAGGR